MQRKNPSKREKEREGSHDDVEEDELVLRLGRYLQSKIGEPKTGEQFELICDRGDLKVNFLFVE